MDLEVLVERKDWLEIDVDHSLLGRLELVDEKESVAVIEQIAADYREHHG